MANEKRLIDANALINWIEECTGDEDWLVSQYNADWIWSMLDSAPAVDAVEVVHGYWYEHLGITICSYCQSMFDTDLTMLQIPSTWKMPNYCPNCGAKMDGDSDA